MSNMIIKDKLIIKKVVIKDNVIIGVHSVISPGTIIESNTIVDAITFTKINQHLEANSMYSGVPARKLELEDPIEDKRRLEYTIFDKDPTIGYDESKLKAIPHELSVPFLFYAISGFIIIGCSYILPGLLFYLFVFGLLVPNFLNLPFSFELLLNKDILIIMFLTPLIFIALYLLHLFFVILITQWFYRYVDSRGPAQGVFDRHMDETSHALDYYHARAFLLKYPIFSVFRSPFPWLINWELRFFGSNKIGKETVLEEGVYTNNKEIFICDCS